MLMPGSSISPIVFRYLELYKSGSARELQYSDTEQNSTDTEQTSTLIQKKTVVTQHKTVLKHRTKQNSTMTKNKTVLNSTLTENKTVLWQWHRTKQYSDKLWQQQNGDQHWQFTIIFWNCTLNHVTFKNFITISKALVYACTCYI